MATSHAAQGPQPAPTAARPQPHLRAVASAIGPRASPADQLAAAMRVVKAARFHAAKRLEIKQSASLFTQSMVALYFVGLAVGEAIYAAQIDEPTHRLITFVAIVSSVFTLMLGLLEALNDNQMKAHHLQTCALTVSELVQELTISQPASPAEIQDFRKRYNDALKACPVNHTRIDYLFATTSARSDRFGWGLLWTRYILNVYGLYAVFLSVPPLLWWVHR